MDFLRRAYHFFLAFAGDLVYRHPSRSLFVIGITGTKGKSTSAEILSAFLEAGDRMTALLSSVRVKIGNEKEANMSGNTMPGRFFIQRFLRRAVRAGCTHAIIEVTSQGIEQFRHRFIDFDAAMFLNLHPEHIESHGSFENYRDTKVRFFRDMAIRSRKPKKYFFLNQSDSASRYFFAAVHGLGEVYYWSRQEFVRLNRGRLHCLSAWLRTEFNLENAAAAAKAAEVIGIDVAAITRVLKNFSGVSGRMETVIREPFRVIIDYAHTPDSLEHVYKFLRGESTKKNILKNAASRRAQNSVPRLICVLGAAGGGRDAWKRPVMGRIAASYCDHAIFTNEDPYDENPESILRMIEEGFTKAFNEKKKKIVHEIVVDRRDAIYRALREARHNDIVVITGKGSESSVHIAGGKSIPWNDRTVVEEFFADEKAKRKNHGILTK